MYGFSCVEPSSPRIAVFCVSVTGPEAQLGLDLSESAPHRKIDTCTRSYQYSFMTDTCFCASRPTPSMSSETVVTRITEIVIDRLRRNPRPISLSMNWKRTELSLSTLLIRQRV